MREFRPALLLLSAAPGMVRAQAASAGPRAEIEAFNRSFDEATRQMDNGATVARWDEGGVSLLPSTKPVVGRKAIAEFIQQVPA